MYTQHALVTVAMFTRLGGSWRNTEAAEADAQGMYWIILTFRSTSVATINSGVISGNQV